MCVWNIAFQCRIGTPSFGICCLTHAPPVESQEQEYRAAFCSFVDVALSFPRLQANLGVSHLPEKEVHSVVVEHEMIDI